MPKINFVGSARTKALKAGLKQPMSTEQFVKEMNKLRNKLDNASSIEEMQQLKKEILALVGARV